MTRLLGVFPVMCPSEETGARLAAVREEPELPTTYRPRPLSPELKRILAAQLPQRRSDEELVARVLDDL